MKYRNVFLYTGLVLLLLLLGCNVRAGQPDTAAPVLTPAPTAVPAPTATPVIALWDGGDAPAVARAIERAVQNIDYGFVALDPDAASLGDFAPDARACAVVCCTGEAPAVRPAGNAFYCMLGGAEIPTGYYGVRYDGATAVQRVFEQILAYPPHCAPVRVLGLFTGEESAAYAAYEAACDSGMLFSRGAYFAGDEKELADWLTEKLDAIYPGMLDGIFAETGELATAAAEALAALSRDDAEIFSASTSGEVLSEMQDRSGLVACAVGYMPEAVAETCVNNAILLSIGETVHTGVLLPEVFLSEGVDAP